jgi:tetratricopeptide (TPR) repeat protein
METQSATRRARNDASTDAVNRIASSALAGGVFIFLAVLIAYLPAMSGGFIWDDDAYVTQNPLLSAPDGLQRIWFSAHHQSQYFPLVFTTLRLEYALWGLNPLGYHVVNILLHAVNALLVWELLKRLALPGAWLAAAIFALHPVQVETAAWITELKNTESTLFYLLALMAWMKFTDDEGRGRWRFYAGAIVLEMLALFAKTTACTLPAPMLLVLWLRNKPINSRRLLQVLPFLVLGVLMGLLSVWWEKHLGAYQVKNGLAYSPLERVLIATHAVWFYLGKLVWPVNLTFSYPHWEINPGDVWQYSWAAACVAVAALLFHWRRSVGRGPIAAMIFFVAVLSPMLGLVSLYTFHYTFVADHYQYLACLGPFALFAAMAVRQAEKCRMSLPARSASALALLSVLGVLTWNQAGAYQNLETLWRDTLKKNPDSWMAHVNLGKVLLAQGRPEESEAQFRDGIRLKPDEEDVRYVFANMLLRAGRIDEAISQYEAAMQLNPSDPDVHNNLGISFYQQHRLDEAIEQFRASIQYNPSDARTHYNLGNALAAAHRLSEAVQECREAVRLDPDSPEYNARLRTLMAQAN